LLSGPLHGPKLCKRACSPRSGTAERVNSRPHRRVDLHPEKESWCRARK
jgi:hypothetical protein